MEWRKFIIGWIIEASMKLGAFILNKIKNKKNEEDEKTGLK